MDLFKKACLIVGGLAALAAPLAAPAAAEDKELRIYNWSDYIDPGVLDKFTQQTGIKVIYDTYDSNDVLETKLLAGKTGYDIVVPTGNFLARQIKAGIFTTLDKSKLPNLKNMDPDVMGKLAIYDPDNAHAINYMWGTTGLGYNVKKAAAADPNADFTTWKTIFDPNELKKFAKCGVEFLDAPDEIIPAALKYLGEDPNSKDPKVLAKALPVLQAIRPYVRKFHSSQYINDLANGDVCLVIGWSGDVLQAKSRAEEAKNGVEVEYSLPKEGGLMWFDNLAIPVDAPHPENAYLFLNFIMDPENIAKCTEFVNYADGNAAARQFISKDILDNPAIYPTPETMKALYIVTPYDAKSQKALNTIWTKVKTSR